MGDKANHRLRNVILDSIAVDVFTVVDQWRGAHFVINLSHEMHER